MGHLVLRLRGGILGKGAFEVDDDFVKKHMGGLTDDDRLLMERFVSQSLEGSEEDTSDKEVRVRRSLFRIGDPMEKVSDDSPLFNMINPQSSSAGEFNYKGKLVETD